MAMIKSLTLRSALSVTLVAGLFLGFRAHAQSQCSKVYSSELYKLAQTREVPESNTVQVAFDKNGHPFVVVDDLTFHGRLVLKPVTLERAEREKSLENSVFAFTLRGFSSGQIAHLKRYLLSLEGEHTLTCANAAVCVLKQGLGVDLGGLSLSEQGQILKPTELLNVLQTRGAFDQNGKPVAIEILADSRMTYDEILARAKRLEGFLDYSYKVLMKVAKEKLESDPNAYLTIDRVQQDRDWLNERSKIQNNQVELPPRWQRITYSVRRIWNFLHSTFHNAGQAASVFIRLDEQSKLIQSLPPFVRPLLGWAFREFGKPMSAGLLTESHPWISGVSPQNSQPIWQQNIIFASSPEVSVKTNDSEIVNRVGGFLASMAAKSTVLDVETPPGAPNPGIPQGKKRRMPHVVNYLHGAVGYNGGFIIFNNFKEGIRYLTDPNFIHHIRSFVKAEKREIMIVFREKEYDEAQYAYTLGVVRSVLPWYANANGPQKKVLWGSVSPFPTINIINGNYLNDIVALERGQTEAIARAPIASAYFSSPSSYNQGLKDSPGFFEKVFAYANYLNILRRGFQGNLAFSPRTVVEPDKEERYNNGQLEIIAPIPNPFVEDKGQSN